MAIEYNTLNQSNIDAIKNRAKNKVDGVYQFRGIAYRVRKGHVTHFATKEQVTLYEIGMLIAAGSYTYEYGENNHMKVLKNL